MGNKQKVYMSKEDRILNINDMNMWFSEENSGFGLIQICSIIAILTLSLAFISDIKNCCFKTKLTLVDSSLTKAMWLLNLDGNTKGTTTELTHNNSVSIYYMD